MTCFTCKKEVDPKIENQTFSNGTVHQRADCPDCGRFLKYMGDPEKADIINFGKYKDRTYREIAQEDPEYLKWLLSVTDKQKVKDLITKAFETR